MKESKFIELLNLYVDQEISPEDTALLESEIQHNPKHQKVYLQYCRMHRACALMHEKFGPDSIGTQPSPGELGGLVSSENTPNSRRTWAYWTGGFAAAACLAFVFVSLKTPQNSSISGDSSSTIASIETPAPSAAISAPVTVIEPDEIPMQLPVMPNNLPRFQLVSMDSEQETPVLYRSIPSQRVPSNWVVPVKLDPIERSFEQDFRLSQPRTTTPRRNYRGTYSEDANVEMTAFQFQR